MLRGQIEAWRAERRSTPSPGDVVISERSARADVFDISVLPAGSEELASRYGEALARGRELARRLRVDAWYTCDQTHYVRVARYRFSGR